MNAFKKLMTNYIEIENSLLNYIINCIKLYYLCMYSTFMDIL